MPTKIDVHTTRQPRTSGRPALLPSRIPTLLRLAHEHGWDVLLSYLTDVAAYDLNLTRRDRGHRLRWTPTPDDPMRWLCEVRSAADDLPAYPSTVDDVEREMQTR